MDVMSRDRFGLRFGSMISLRGRLGTSIPCDCFRVKAAITTFVMLSPCCYSHLSAN